MKKFLLTFIVLSMSCSSLERKIIDNDVVIEAAECGGGHCIKLSYVNRFDRAVCIKNTLFPYDGNLNENVFRVTNSASAEASRYQLIEPSMVTTSRNAVLVRLVPAGGVATTKIDLSRFYDVEKGQAYRIDYSSRAYFCDQYANEEKFILLSGHNNIN